MSVDITIKGTTISFPTSGTSADWGEAVTDFAQLVESTFNSVVGSGTYDVAPQNFTIDAYNPGTDVDITTLQFPISNVRAVFIKYSVFRTTNSDTAYEQGNLLLVYSPSNPVNSKWEMNRDYIGDGKISFSVSDSGQVRFSTTVLSGTGHAGKIAFTAQALLQS